MRILGLNITEISTAALFDGNGIKSGVTEERFSRNKNDARYPKKSIEFCTMDGKPDIVAIGSNEFSGEDWLMCRFSDFSIEDHIKEQHKYWYPKFYEGKNPKLLEIFKDKIDMEQYPGREKWEKLLPDIGDQEKLCQFIKETVSQDVGIPKDKIIFVDHHTAHAHYAYFASPFRDKPCLVFTIDGYGDGLNATISVCKENKIERIFSQNDANIGRLYRYITLLLGMKPNEHEYKVMGLAPYGMKYYEKAYQAFKETMYIDGLEFKYNVKPKDLYFHYKERLEGCRFDNIAAGLQTYVEELLCQWVKNAIKQTSIHRIVFSGGVAMNCKGMQKIHELEEVEEIYVPATGSDLSNAIGACYCIANEKNQKIEPLNSIYIGPTPGQPKKETTSNYKTSKYTSEKAAKLLAEGKVIAICAGKMEFGARALGNRSIIADPRNTNTIKKINEMIKKRDFWMPFAPTILHEKQHEYVTNPKNIQAPHMTLTFNTTKKAQKQMPAATHPYDLTTRPQILKKEDNPQYHQLIKEFEELTGVSTVLNTSFNLHGYPIVCTADDALHVFKNSGLDALILNDLLIEKQPK